MYKLFIRESRWVEYRSFISFRQAIAVAETLIHERCKIETKNQIVARCIYGKTKNIDKEHREEESLYRFANCTIFEKNGELYMLVSRMKDSVVAYKIAKLSRHTFERLETAKRITPQEFANA